MSGVDHQGAVERRSDLQRCGPPAARRARLHRTVDGVARARQRTLQRAVAIGQHGIDAFVGEHAVQVGQRRLHRDHRAAVTRALGHHSAAQLRESPQAIVIETIGGTQGDELAVAVAGRAVGADAEALQDPQHRQTDRPERRLGDISPGERCLLLGAGARVKHRMREDAIAQTLRRRGC